MITKSKFLTLLLAISTTTVLSLKASAQTPAGAGTTAPPVAVTKHQEVKHVAHDIRNERREKAIRRHDIKNDNAKGAVRSTRQIRRDKRNERRNVKALKADGVKHPVRRAEHRIRTH